MGNPFFRKLKKVKPTAVAVPKGRPAALTYVSQLVEEAKASGRMRRAFDDVGLKSAVVAPAGMRP